MVNMVSYQDTSLYDIDYFDLKISSNEIRLLSGLYLHDN